MDWTGKRALVTGAGRGVGRAVAALLAGRGVKVVALSRNEEDLRSLAREIGCETLAVDLSDVTSIGPHVAAALPVDFLVHCASTAGAQAFLDIALDEFNRVHAVNVAAPMVLSQVVVRDWLRHGVRGAIVNVSSDAAMRAINAHGAYCASKAALDAMTRVMALELGPCGIRVNSVNPALPIQSSSAGYSSTNSAIAARIPQGRFPEPDEVAEAVLFLLSDAASTINGVSLPVDGGLAAS